MIILKKQKCILKQFNLFPREKATVTEGSEWVFVGLLVVIAITSVALLFILDANSSLFFYHGQSHDYFENRLMYKNGILPILIMSNIYMMFVLPFVIKEKRDLITYLYTVSAFVVYVFLAIFGFTANPLILAIFRLVVLVVYVIFTIFFNLNKGGILSCIDLGTVNWVMYASIDIHHLC